MRLRVPLIFQAMRLPDGAPAPEGGCWSVFGPVPRLLVMSAPERERVDSTVVDQVGQYTWAAATLALTPASEMSTNPVDNAAPTRTPLISSELTVASL
jgi:hypothetical protein